MKKSSAIHPHLPGLTRYARAISLARTVAKAQIQKVNFKAVTLAHDEHLTRYYEEWSRLFKEDSDPNGNFQFVYLGVPAF